MSRRFSALALVLVLSACGGSEETAPTAGAPDPAPAPAAAAAPAAPAADAPLDHDQGLLVSISKFAKGPDGRPLPSSELIVLVARGGGWLATSYQDPEAFVFHKAMPFTPADGEPGVVTLAGAAPGKAATLKLWRKGADGFAPVETIWTKNFGGKFSRMRDAEQADLFGDGIMDLAVATHDQGVVAVIRPQAGGGYEVTEIDAEPSTFVHEIEIGDLDGDGVPEVYATPSEPNRLDGTPQHGSVVRYVPAKGEGRVEVADLGDRHAKEILVDDVDGDGRDELYVSIEAAQGGDLEVRRFEGDDAADEGAAIATVTDPMARFLTAGDVDGDGKKEMVLAAKDTGLWLLRPGDDPRATWDKTLIDAKSHGFEHAALLTDLDGDGKDELYVASDDDAEIRRYRWSGSGFDREVIFKRTDGASVLTWNLNAVPVDLVE